MVVVSKRLIWVSAAAQVDRDRESRNPGPLITRVFARVLIYRAVRDLINSTWAVRECSLSYLMGLSCILGRLDADVNQPTFIHSPIYSYVNHSLAFIRRQNILLARRRGTRFLSVSSFRIGRPQSRYDLSFYGNVIILH